MRGRGGRGRTAWVIAGMNRRTGSDIAPVQRTRVITAGAVAVALLGALCYPLVTPAVQYAPPLQLGGLRALLGGLMLVVFSEWTGRRRPQGRQWLAVVAIGVCSTGLGFAGMFLAGGRVTPGIATVIANTQPLLAAVLGSFVVGETLKRFQLVGMGVAFAGVALVAIPTLLPSSGVAVSPSGIGFVLIGAVGVAFGNVVMKRFAADLDAISATGWQLLVGSACLLGTAALMEPSAVVRWTSPLPLSLVGLAGPGTAVAFALWFALIRRAPLNHVNVFSFLTPVFALIIGAGLYGERLGPFALIGSGFVLAGAWVAVRSSGHRS